MSIVFQCSIKKANWKKEKAILVEAGLMLEWHDNLTIKYNPAQRIWTAQGPVEVPKLWLDNHLTNDSNLLLTARQFSQVVLLHKLNPSLNTRDLIASLKLNQRNRWNVYHSPFREVLVQTNQPYKY